MNIKKAEHLRKEWGDKECNHPKFEKETFPAVYETDWVEQKTGDYVCIQCGQSFTKEEMIEIIKKHNP